MANAAGVRSTLTLLILAHRAYPHFPCISILALICHTSKIRLMNCSVTDLHISIYVKCIMFDNLLTVRHSI